METVRECPSKIPWDKGKIVGQKLPLSFADYSTVLAPLAAGATITTNFTVP